MRAHQYTRKLIFNGFSGSRNTDASTVVWLMMCTFWCMAQNLKSLATPDIMEPSTEMQIIGNYAETLFWGSGQIMTRDSVPDTNASFSYL